MKLPEAALRPSSRRPLGLLAPVLVAGVLPLLARPAASRQLPARVAELHPTTVQGAESGRHVAVDGELLAAAAPGEAQTYVYHRDGRGQWLLEKLVTGSASVVELVGDTLFIGNFGGGTGGLVRVHERNLGGPRNWGLRKTIEPSVPQFNSDFGVSIDASGGRLLVGATHNGPGDRGAAFVFRRDLGGSNQWGQQLLLQPSSLSNGSFFGHTVALEGNIAAVGAFQNNGPRLYVFESTAGPLIEATVPWLPTTLALQGDLLVAGAGSGIGLFRRLGPGAWAHEKTLTRPGTQTFFGSFVDVGPTQVVAATSNEPEPVALLFSRDTGGPGAWGVLARVYGDDPAFRPYGIALDEGTLVFGQPTVPGAPLHHGTAWVYDLVPSLAGDVEFLSYASGGQVSLELDAGPAFADLPFLLGQSDAGAYPGLRFGGRWLPVNDSAFLRSTLLGGAPWLSGTPGMLDGNGRATVVFDMPPASPPFAAGTELTHAAVVLAPFTPSGNLAPRRPPSSRRTRSP